jgi:hypothetical protein
MKVNIKTQVTFRVKILINKSMKTQKELIKVKNQCIQIITHRINTQKIKVN